MLSSARAARICAAVMIRDPSTTGRTEPYRICMHYAGSTTIFNACPIKVDGVRTVLANVGESSCSIGRPGAAAMGTIFTVTLRA